MSKLTQKYEISVWDVQAQQETKLAIIGANDMLTPARAQSPQLKRNINGTKTLTFSLFTKYVDEIDGERKINPFCNIIHNETRIKLKWKEKWYEFIVKNISEDSENYKNTYTAEDAFISELSRKGFNIELSTDVGGNSGTIIELEDKILENSDWKVDKENSIVGPQLKEDTLVKLIVTKEIEAKQKCEFDENGVFKIIDKDFKIPVNSIIYSFYSSIYKKDSFFQFFYNEDGYEFGDDGFIINCPIYCISDYEYAGELPENTSENEITTYKGKKLIRTQESHYDSVIKNYVKHYYSSNNKEIYGYTETEYVTDEFVNNLATNGKEFVTDVGWYSLTEESKDEANSEIELYVYPGINTVLEKLRKNKSVDSKSYIRITPNTNQSGAYLFYNTGFEDNKTFIETLSDGQKFVIRLKYGYKLNNSKDDEPIDMQINKNRLVSGLNVSLCEYKIGEDGYPIPTSVIFKTRLDGNAENAFKKDGNYWTAICECNKSYSKLKLIEANIGLFFSYDFNGSGKITASNLKKYSFCIEEFEFFEFKERVIESKDTDREYYLPEETVSGEAKIKYNYFLADQEYEEFDDIEFLYRGYKEKNYKQKYIPNYQQIRVIEEKESNIFNLTQTLCESFETWADFVVEHDDLGYIKKDSNGDFIKKIVFKPYIGKENWSGFHYKTNLKSIQRVTESKQITTKSIVKPNYNEFAPSGFCTIAYSDENPSGESFIYDFRYYENQNILNTKTVLEDLQGTKGLYPQLKELNKQIQDEITKRTEITAQLLYLEKDKEVYSAKVSELQTSIATNKKDFKLLTGTSYEKFPKSANKEEYLELSEVSGDFLVILKETNELQKAQKKYSEIKKQYNTEKKNYKTSVNKIKDLTKQKEKLILDFETKYAPFIQEGTWISNEYIDHNLYYIDAKVVAATSALPQVTYTINVLDLSSMEEFKNYNIEIGDKTYITDPEFFGYIESQGFYTPRRQEVIISEMVEELEEPEKNKFTVQNFKTQFEDIFHRITAATQQLKLNEGAYQRASNAFSNQGLNSEKVQDSFNSSNFTLTNNTNQWDTQGFVSENSQSKQSIKIHDGAIMISGAVSASNNGNTTNRSSEEVENYSLEVAEEISTASYNTSPASTAPETWTKIITSKGINANYIYAGQIDAGKINIVTELKTTEDQDLEYAVAFDKDGLSMYGYDTGKKIRLRLGKVLEDDTLTELYGLQLYNEEGEQTFRTDSEGNITITGEIIAGSGIIGGWGIEEDRLVHYTGNDNTIDAMISTEEGEYYSVNDYSSNNWRILFGIEGNTGNFGVTSTGNLFANGVDIKDGNISIGDIFKVTSNGGKDQVMTYGLNIKLNPENQNQEIVIESDDRVIGIRERRQDGKGWTWKTILGDLTNATLGGKPLSDYGLSGYGLCTENGLFSGTIYAGSGKIGNFEITDDSIINKISGDSFFPSGEEKQASGIYLGRDGTFFCGNEDSFIKFSKEGKESSLSMKTEQIFLAENKSALFFGRQNENGYYDASLSVYLPEDSDLGNFIIDTITDFSIYSYDFFVRSIGKDYDASGAPDGLGTIYIGDYYTNMQGKFEVSRLHVYQDKEYTFDAKLGITTQLNGISYFKTNHGGIKVALEKTSVGFNPDVTGELLISEYFDSNTGFANYGYAKLKVTGQNGKKSIIMLETNPSYTSYLETTGEFKLKIGSSGYFESTNFLSSFYFKNDIILESTDLYLRNNYGIYCKPTNQSSSISMFSLDSNNKLQIGNNNYTTQINGPVSFSKPAEARASLGVWTYDLTSNTSHPGLAAPDGTTAGYVRVPESGIIPFKSGGHGTVGTSGWPFNHGYFNQVHVSNSIILNNDKQINGISVPTEAHPKAEERQVLKFNANNNTVLGYGGYTASEGVTNIYGNGINLYSKSTITFNNTNVLDFISDSGWKSPSIGSNFKTHSDNPLKYRKVGKVVNISGAVKPSKTLTMSEDTWYDVFTIDSGWDPVNGTIYLIGQGSNDKIFTYRFSGTKFQLGRYRSGSTYSNASTDSAFYFNMTYITA